MISFKIENLPPKERQVVDAWADGQSNIQQSLANIIMHVVSWSGDADVMDFEVQRKLHSLLADKPVAINIPAESNAVIVKETSQPQQPVNDQIEIKEDDPLEKAKKMQWD